MDTSTRAPIAERRRDRRTWGRPWWRIVVAGELSLAVVAVLVDWFLPTLLILGVAACSLLGRREGLASLGMRRVDRPLRLLVEVFGISVGWTLLVWAVTMPALEHVTGRRQDLGMFEDVEGNLGLLAALVLASWTLAAVGEELAYRGFVLTRLRELLPRRAWAVPAAVVLTALLFGLAHGEQGIVGVTLATLDGVLFGVLRCRYRTLWASVLAHGFNNTIGLVVFFALGPVYGLW